MLIALFELLFVVSDSCFENYSNLNYLVYFQMSNIINDQNNYVKS